MNDDINDLILKAHERSFKRAYEVALRTGTSLIFARGNKIVEVKPASKKKPKLLPRKK